MENKKNFLKKENIILCIILLLITIMSSYFMFDKVLYRGVDTEYHMSRIIGITNSWKEGYIPAYIHLDTIGYGYAMGFFYSNLFMIIPCLLYLLGFDIISTYKLFIIICSFFTVISMYICTKKITKNKYAAIVSTILYSTCAYRIITLVAKAFVGELLSFIFIPIIILGLYEIIFEDEKKWWIFALGFIGILNSNLVMTEIMIAVSAVMLLCNITKLFKSRKRLFSLIKATVIALLITAAFWMPMLEQLINTEFEMIERKEIYDPSKWLLDFKNIFSGTIQYDTNVAAAYGLGIIFVFIMIFRPKIKEESITIKFCDISILSGLLLLLAMTKFIPWEKIKDIGETIQFPSRFEVPIAAFFSIACGIICSRFADKNKILRNLIVICIVVWQMAFSVMCYNSCIESIKYLNGSEEIEKITVKEDFTYNICDGVYLPQNSYYRYFLRDYEEYEFLREFETNNFETKFYDYQKDGLEINISFKNNTKKDTYIDFPIHYYYGYVAEGKDLYNYKIEKNDEGIIRVYLEDRQEDIIRIHYKNTTIQKISMIITFVTIISYIVYITILKIKGRYKNEQNRYTKT